MSEKKLDGKVTIVTGAGSAGKGIGTGKAMAVLFAREGSRWCSSTCTKIELKRRSI